jgi:hypothetical protein
MRNYRIRLSIRQFLLVLSVGGPLSAMLLAPFFYRNDEDTESLPMNLYAVLPPSITVRSPDIIERGRRLAAVAVHGIAKLELWLSQEEVRSPPPGEDVVWDQTKIWLDLKAGFRRDCIWSCNLPRGSFDHSVPYDFRLAHNDKQVAVAFIDHGRLCFRVVELFRQSQVQHEAEDSATEPANYRHLRVCVLTEHISRTVEYVERDSNTTLHDFYWTGRSWHATASISGYTVDLERPSMEVEWEVVSIRDTAK